MKKKEGKPDFWKKAALGGGIALLTAGIFYGAGAFYYRERFFYGTQINDIPCANLTVKEAEQKLKEKVEDYTLEISLKEGKKESLSGKEIDYTYVPDKEVEKALKKQNPFAWITGFFHAKEYTAGENITFDESLLKEKINAMDCVQEANMKPPKDAYIAFKNNQFVIKEEELGTAIELEKLQEKAKEAVGKSQSEISAEESGVYKLPAVTKENETLKQQQEVWNSCAAVTVKYTFGEQTEILDGMTVKEWMTYTVMKRLLAVTYLQGVFASALTEDMTDYATDEISTILRRNHKLKASDDDDFTIRTQQELSTMLNSTTDLMTTLLACIAGISLVVGGIGIMNIMYVSVTERTREIGLRMSVGARGVDILSQFLIEAIMISITGGIIGVIIGCGASWIVKSVAHWPIYIQPWSVFLSFAVCTVTGVFFGWYPAKKAADLDPIEAIRYE